MPHRANVGIPQPRRRRLPRRNANANAEPIATRGGSPRANRNRACHGGRALHLSFRERPAPRRSRGISRRGFARHGASDARDRCGLTRAFGGFAAASGIFLCGGCGTRRRAARARNAPRSRARRSRRCDTSARASERRRRRRLGRVVRPRRNSARSPAAVGTRRAGFGRGHRARRAGDRSGRDGRSAQRRRPGIPCVRAVFRRLVEAADRIARAAAVITLYGCRRCGRGSAAARGVRRRPNRRCRRRDPRRGSFSKRSCERVR